MERFELLLVRGQGLSIRVSSPIQLSVVASRFEVARELGIEAMSRLCSLLSCTILAKQLQ